jgi:hypothetical protein
LMVRFLSKSVMPVVITVITLSIVVLPALVHTPLLAQSSSIDFSQEYSSGDVQVFPSLDAWYTWININGTHVIFLALHSTQLPSPVSAFVGESYNTSSNSRVFVANALMAMEVYNDTNNNGILDANYATGQTELLYTITLNASQTFTPSPVQKTVVNGVPHYTWGVTYGSVQGGLVKVDPAYGYAYDEGTDGATLMMDHLSLFYDYSVVGNATYLKTNYEIGNITLSNPTLPNITLKGLSLSLLHFVLAAGSAPYSVTANSSPYDSQTSQASSQVNVAQLTVNDGLAYEFLFNDNYTLETNPPESLRTVFAAASSNSLPAGAFQGQGALQVIRAQDYVKNSLPSIAGLPASSDLNYSTSKLIYRICYPTWGGVGINEDPTFVAYYVPNLLTVSLPVPGYGALIFYLAVGAAAVAIVSAALFIRRTRKGRTQDRQIS